MRKSLRALEIARENRLPVRPARRVGRRRPARRRARSSSPAARAFRDITELSAAGIPTIAIVFGNSTAGGAYVPGMSDYVVMIKERSKVFLGGPPLVKMATGEESDDESLGGAEMHARVQRARRLLRRRRARRASASAARSCAASTTASAAPVRVGPDARRGYDPDQLLGIPSVDRSVPFDPRDVIARVVDDSEFDEFKPLYGSSLVTGFAELHGYPIGILANHRGVLFSEESHKAAQFIQLANQIDTPLVFLQNTTGYMVGKDFEQRGIIKDGAKMINAVTNSTVPHLTINMAASYGAGNYGMCGRAYGPRFLFTWPNAKTAVMGPQQLAGVMSIVAHALGGVDGQAVRRGGRRGDAQALVEDQIERESLALFMTGRLYDDGIIDPRDTRTVLGMCLSAVHNNEIRRHA